MPDFTIVLRHVILMYVYLLVPLAAQVSVLYPSISALVSNRSSQHSVSSSRAPTPISASRCGRVECGRRLSAPPEIPSAGSVGHSTCLSSLVAPHVLRGPSCCRLHCRRSDGRPGWSAVLLVSLMTARFGEPPWGVSRPCTKLSQLISGPGPAPAVGWQVWEDDDWGVCVWGEDDWGDEMDGAGS